MPAHIKAMLTAVNLNSHFETHPCARNLAGRVFVGTSSSDEEKANRIECCGSLTRLILLLANVIHPAFMTLGIQYHTRKIV